MVMLEFPRMRRSTTRLLLPGQAGASCLLTTALLVLLLVLVFDQHPTEAFGIEKVGPSRRDFCSRLSNPHRLFASSSPQQTYNDNKATIERNSDDKDDSVKSYYESSTTASKDSMMVQVEISRDLPTTTTPERAQQAWLDFVWKGGGGLPVFVVPKATDSSDAATSSSAGRLLLPVFMEEKLVDDEKESSAQSNTILRQKYRVSKWGLNPDLVPDSHLGVVEFEKTGETTKMIWRIEFQVTARRAWWQAMTDFLISVTSDNLVAYLRPPLLYRRTTRIKVPPTNKLREQDHSAAIRDAWLDFVWQNGGGLPILPPISIQGPPRRTRMYIPPFLQESIVSTDSNNKLEYQMENPSLWTCYPAHTHQGTVRFETVEPPATAADGNDETPAEVRMVWEVHVNPYRGCEGYVQAFTSAIVSTLARNFRSHLEEPGAVVKVKPPRGGSGEVLFQVEKATWLGGVLDAHLSDQRSTWEQTVAMFQPWTWGRGDNDNGEDGDEWITMTTTEEREMESHQ